MEIFLNGKRVVVEKDVDICQLLKMQQLNHEGMVIEYNLSILAKEKWQHVRLKEDDRLEILKFVGGG